jgi:phage repressor protein C with HTH and peptisase S24 domain
MDKDDPRQRLLALADGRRVSLSGLSRMIGKNESYLQQFVRKGSPRKLEEGDRAMLARFFGVPEAELGAPLQKSGADWVDIPRLPLGASAGSGAMVDGEGAIGSFRFSPRWLRDQGLQADRLSAIAVKGDSMEPTLRDGDEILVDHALRGLRDGIYVVRLDGTLLVKRLDTRRSDRIVLRSDNRNYPQIECDIAAVEVIGRVVWKSGRL